MSSITSGTETGNGADSGPSAQGRRTKRCPEHCGLHPVTRRFSSAAALCGLHTNLPRSRLCPGVSQTLRKPTDYSPHRALAVASPRLSKASLSTPPGARVGPRTRRGSRQHGARGFSGRESEAWACPSPRVLSPTTQVTCVCSAQPQPPIRGARGSQGETERVSSSWERGKSKQLRSPALQSCAPRRGVHRLFGKSALWCHPETGFSHKETAP